MLAASLLIRAAIAGCRRSLSRHRARFGPMLPIGMPSLALISAYGTGGSVLSRPSQFLAARRAAPRTPRAARRGARRRAALPQPPAGPASGRSAGPGPAPAASYPWDGARVRTRAGSWWPASPAARPDRAGDLAVHQREPDGLAYILGVGPLQPVAAADRPDQRGVPLDECVPGLLARRSWRALPGRRLAGNQPSGYRPFVPVPGGGSGSGRSRAAYSDNARWALTAR